MQGFQYAFRAAKFQSVTTGSVLEYRENITDALDDLNARVVPATCFYELSYEGVA